MTLTSTPRRVGVGDERGRGAAAAARALGGGGAGRAGGGGRGLHGGGARVISDCHFSVQLNHFIPGFLSYSVPVFLK